MGSGFSPGSDWNSKSTHQISLKWLSILLVTDEGFDSHILWGVSVEDRKYGVPRIDILRSTPVRRRFLSIEPLLEDLGQIDLSGIHWVIVGGESGPSARSFALEWAESLIEVTRRQGVPIFIKQIGRKPMLQGNPFSIIGQDGKKDTKGKTMEEWPEHLQVRDFPVAV